MTRTRGTTVGLEQLAQELLAALASRRGQARISRTYAVLVDGAPQVVRRPLIVTTISSRCHLSPGRGCAGGAGRPRRRVRTWRTTAGSSRR